MNSLTPDELDLLERIDEKAALQPFFFQKAKGLKWFDALAERGYFDPERNPRPQPSKEVGYVNVPFWPPAEYLVSASIGLRADENFGYAEKFINLMRAVTKYAIDHHYSNYRTWWQFSKVIQNIPPTLILDDDMPLFDYWMSDPYEAGIIAEEIGEHWINNLLKSGSGQFNELGVKLLEIVFKLEFYQRERGSKSRREARFRLSSYSARKITEKVAGNAGGVIGIKAVRLFQERLESILRELNNDKWSCIWRSAIEQHQQNHSADDAADIVIEGYRDSLLAWVKDGGGEAHQYVEELLQSQYETIQRVAVYVIGQRYIYLRKLVDTVISDKFFKSNFRHELWHLLKNNYLAFSSEQKQLVLGVIEGLAAIQSSEPSDKGAIAYRKATWLSAIKDYDHDIAKRYQECIEVVGGEPENPDFSSYMTSGWVDHRSPFSVEELLPMEVDELVKLLAKYYAAYTPRYGRDNQDIEGLLKTLRHLVKGNPLRYYNQLQYFAESDLPFVYELIEAYRDLWSENAQLPWNEIWGALLGFCLNIVGQPRFWSVDAELQNGAFVANRHWIVNGIGKLIEAGTKSDEHAFSESFLGLAEEIVLILLEKEKGEPFKVDDDAVMLAINSPRGQCIEALINLSLRACRLENSRSGNHQAVWEHFKPIYDAELKRADISEYEFATLVVNFLPNFLYMSKQWVLENIDSIFDRSSYQKWLCALQGYAYVDKVHKIIYEHLRNNGHFIFALDDEILSNIVGEKIIQNIAVAYLNNFESLDDESSLINKLIVRGDSNELGQLIWFFWSLRKDGDENLSSKVFALWPRLLKVIDKNSREGRRLASKLCDWSIFVDEVNEENKHLVLEVATFAEEDYNAYGLIESIAKISDKQPFEAFEIWQSLIENAKPCFPEESIRVALFNLARVGPDGIRKARIIVSEYLKGGNEKPSLWLAEIIGAGVANNR